MPSQVTETDLWARTSTIHDGFADAEKYEQLAGIDGLTDAVTIYHHMHFDAGEIEEEPNRRKKKTFSGHQSFGVNWPKRKNSAGHFQTESQRI